MQLLPGYPIIFFLVVVLGLCLSLYKVTDASHLYLLMTTSGQIQDIDPYRCWSNISLTSSTLAQRCLVGGSMMVFAGINITLLCKNNLCFQLSLSAYILLPVLYFGVTYKPTRAGHDLVILIHLYMSL